MTASGKSHPVLRQDVFWECVLSNMVLDAYGNFTARDIVCKELDDISNLRSHHGDPALDSRQPDCLPESLAYFEQLIDRYTKGLINLWKGAMTSSPPLRQQYVREPRIQKVHAFG